MLSMIFKIGNTLSLVDLHVFFAGCLIAWFFSLLFFSIFISTCGMSCQNFRSFEGAIIAKYLWVVFFVVLFFFLVWSI